MGQDNNTKNSGNIQNTTGINGANQTQDGSQQASEGKKSVSFDQLKKQRQDDLIKGQVKKNQAYFYGLPLVVGSLMLITIFVFVVPFFSTYPENQSKISIANRSIQNTNESIENLTQIQAEEQDINQLINRLDSRIPTESKPGNIANIIQSVADDFNLEARRVATPAPEFDEDGQLQQEEDDGQLLESLGTGEVELQPAGTINPNLKARQININLEIQGNKQNFLNFIDQIKQTDPVINLVNISYEEGWVEGATDGDFNDITVSATFESFALLPPDEEDYSYLNQSYSSYLETLDTEISAEQFDWNQEEIEGVLDGTIDLNGFNGNSESDIDEEF